MKASTHVLVPSVLAGAVAAVAVQRFVAPDQGSDVRGHAHLARQLQVLRVLALRPLRGCLPSSAPLD